MDMHDFAGERLDEWPGMLEAVERFRKQKERDHLRTVTLSPYVVDLGCSMRTVIKRPRSPANS